MMTTRAVARRRRQRTAQALTAVLAVVGALVLQAVPAFAGKAPISVSISASATSVTVGQAVTLTASASRNVKGSGLYLEVFDQTGGTVLAACATGTTCRATVTQSTATTRSYVAQTADAASGSGVRARSSALSVSWTSTTSGGGGGGGTTGDPVVVAAGDIACDPADSNFSGADPSSCQMAATANRIKAITPSYLLPIGDTQYDLAMEQGQQPSISQYTNGYGASWGQLPGSIAGLTVRPTPGNHEWGDPNETQAQPLTATNYFQYFASSLPSGVTATNDWYSFDVPVTGGSWHVISLDSECGAVGGCGAGSKQESWLRSDLAAHPGQCIAAYWHIPRFSSGAAGSDTLYDAFWQDLYAAHAAIVLGGHDHDYERFAPQSPSGRADPAGITEFVVGTGGVNLGWMASALPNTKYRDNATFGVLQLTLHAGSADFAYRTAGGATPDAGTVTCPTA